MPVLAALPFVLLLVPLPSCSQTISVTGAVEVTNLHSHEKKPDSSGVVVWLTPVGESGAADTPSQPVPGKRRVTLTQENKTFTPHILVIPVGAQVEFPNKDPFFHNVFSLFEGKRFDLGLYESSSTRSLSFDRPGISYLFCNIHSEMSAVIITLDTPYYSVSDRAGQVTIPDVRPGRYILRVWREGSTPSTLKSLARSVVVSHEAASFGKVAVPDNAALPLSHKNLYGKDYEEPAPPGGIYRPH
jgi:plastocyanin